jgi:2,3-bisphosphoglycerate-dependent phosphoglycerate mutase
MARRIAAFIRHAVYQQLVDTPSALQPFALTEAGIAQSKQSASEMRDYIQQNEWQLDPSIHTSTSLRAWQTAQLFAAQLQADLPVPATINSFDALTERSVGCAANLTIKQIEQIIKADPRYDDLPDQWKSDSYFKLPLQGAESLLEAGQRVAKHLNDVMAQVPTNNDDVVKLFVGHGASFRHAAYTLGVIDFEQIATLSMHHAKPIYLEYRTDGSWQHIAGEWKARPQKNQYID